MTLMSVHFLQHVFLVKKLLIVCLLLPRQKHTWILTFEEIFWYFSKKKIMVTVITIILVT